MGVRRAGVGVRRDKVLATTTRLSSRGAQRRGDLGAGANGNGAWRGCFASWDSSSLRSSE